MSIFDRPRIYFRGKVSWDPGVANNSGELYDPERVELVLPPGVSLDGLKAHIIANCDEFGIWNYYGTHNATFENVVVSGGALPDGRDVVADPLVGAPVTLTGKLVDVDAATVHGTQWFAEALTLGEGATGFKGVLPRRMHARGINFFRNLEPRPIAGIAGASWLTVLEKADVRLSGQDQSELLQAMATALEDPAARGLVVRFDTYATEYFQNGLQNQIPQQPRTIQELMELYRAGENFSNPAYSVVIGCIAIWREGEPQSTLGRRTLAAAARPFVATRLRPRPDGGVEAVQVPAGAGPAFAFLDERDARLSFDFGATIPETGASLENADIGNLTIVAVRDGQSTTVGTILSTAYGRSSREQ